MLMMEVVVMVEAEMVEAMEEMEEAEKIEEAVIDPVLSRPCASIASSSSASLRSFNASMRSSLAGAGSASGAFDMLEDFPAASDFL